MTLTSCWIRISSLFPLKRMKKQMIAALISGENSIISPFSVNLHCLTQPMVIKSKELMSMVSLPSPFLKKKKPSLNRQKPSVSHNHDNR